MLFLAALTVSMVGIGCSDDDPVSTAAVDGPGDSATDGSTADGSGTSGSSGSGASEGPAADPDAPVSSPEMPQTDPPVGPGMATPKVVDPAATDPRPTTLQSLTVAADGVTVEMTLWGGPCDGIAAVDLAEGEQQVTVAVSVGSVVPPGTACIELAEQWSTTATLSAPLGDRALVDANAGR